MQQFHIPCWLKIIGLAAAAVFLIEAGYLAFIDKPGSAAIAAGTSVALLVLILLPHLESFEALGVKAHFRKQVAEADKLLEDLRSSAMVSATLVFHQLAWMNRWAAPSWEEKKELATLADALLERMHVDKPEIQRVKEPFLRFIELDLYRVFLSAAQVKLDDVRLSAQRKHDQHFTGPIRVDDPVHQEWLKERERLNYEIPRLPLPGRGDDVKMKDLVSSVLANFPARDDDLATLEKLGSEITALSEGVRDAGTITPAAEEFLDKFGSTADRNEVFTKVFGRRPR